MAGIKQIWIFVLVLSLISCTDNKHDVHADSSGDINEISIIIDDALWNGAIGDSLRKKLAAPVEGLTQEEPLFTLNQYNEKVFDGGLTRGRNIIVIEKDDKGDFTFKRNRYCSPQNIFTLKGKTDNQLLSIIETHANEIIKAIRETEIAENQERNIELGVVNQERFANQYGISINIPSSYKYAVKNDSFVWLKKDIPSGNSNIMIYQVPFDIIEKNKTIVNNIIVMRDSIGSKYVHGQEPGTFMATEEAYSPYVFTTNFKNKMAFETRGNWEMANDMSGPFLNYTIRDDKKSCYLIIEGFIYSPSSPKRDLIIELESIIKSVNFKNEPKISNKAI